MGQGHLTHDITRQANAAERNRTHNTAKKKEIEDGKANEISISIKGASAIGRRD